MAKKLLNAGKAAVYRRFPFTIILKKQCTPSKSNLELKIDPGSQTTGIALVQDNKVIWVAQLNHRGSLIKKKLESRRASRRLGCRNTNFLGSKYFPRIGLNFEFCDRNI